MQITRLPLAVLTISTAFILIGTSCKKSGGSGTNASLSATIGTTNYNPSLTAGFDQDGYVNVEGLMISSGDSLSLSVSIPDTATRTSLLISDADVQVEYVDTKGKFDYSNWSYPSHGTLTITSWDKTNLKIAGKFSGVLYNELSSTDSVNISGQFNTTYIQ